MKSFVYNFLQLQYLRFSVCNRCINVIDHIFAVKPPVKIKVKCASPSGSIDLPFFKLVLILNIKYLKPIRINDRKFTTSIYSNKKKRYKFEFL